MERVTEYTIIFKDNTELGNKYKGEYITEGKSESDKIFEENKEQIDQYYAKDWVFVNNDWQEDSVKVFF